ncbi:MAG: hypothetical protein D6677_02995 [Calditrichaeota bacterium]|nr:MAG: hypothetical protein D6677_02995 [Calditrichota bacterium]
MRFLLTLYLLFGLSACSLFTNSSESATGYPAFANAPEGESWLYLVWNQGPDDAQPVDTGDSLRVTVMENSDQRLVLSERFLPKDNTPVIATVTIFLKEDNQLVLDSPADQTVFGFAALNANRLPLGRIDSNRVTLTNFDELKDQLTRGQKETLVGYSDTPVRTLGHIYDNIHVYYTRRAVPLDGPAYIGLFSPQVGLLSTTYFLTRSGVDSGLRLYAIQMP